MEFEVFEESQSLHSDFEEFPDKEEEICSIFSSLKCMCTSFFIFWFHYFIFYFSWYAKEITVNFFEKS